MCYLEDVPRNLTDLPSSDEEPFAHECRIRDLYASRLVEFRPEEVVLNTEYAYASSRIRADMRTVSREGTIRVWEFKIFASYEGLGQALTYLALARKEEGFERRIQAVLAAFDFKPEIRTAVEVLNLGVELVQIPGKLRLAGGVPYARNAITAPVIPHISDLTLPTTILELS
jgi:hypothetical protein